MSQTYDGFRAGMLRAADMARNEFKRAPEAAKGHDCVYMGGYEDACDHLSAAIAQAAVIDCVRVAGVAGAQPDWQYHISLLLPDEGVDDASLLKIFQVVEHELRTALSSRDQEIREVLEGLRLSFSGCWCQTRSLQHSPACLAARGLWERVSEKGHEHGGIQPKP